MKLYNTTRGILVTDDQSQHCAALGSIGWDELIAATDLFDRAQKALAGPSVAPPAANEIARADRIAGGLGCRRHLLS